MKTQLKFYSGIHTIGGVCMSIIYNNQRIILELGAAYNPSSDVFDGKVLQRDSNYISDSILLGLIPKVEGIYPKEYIKNIDLKSYEEVQLPTTAFISHLHLDHMLFMGMLHDEVDIYLCKEAQVIEQALQDTNQGCYSIRKVDYKDFSHLDTIYIGDIKITPYLINPRSYKDWSFYVETPDLKLHYTGDVILHNANAENVLNEMKWLKEKNIDVLVCDATSFMDSTMEMIYANANTEVIADKNLPPNMLDEKMVENQLLENMKNKTGLCVINFYQREMAEVEKFEHMAKQCNRILILEPKTAYIVYKFFNKKVNIYLPDFKENKHNDKQWYKTLIKNATLVTNEEITLNPHKYLLQNSYEYIMELFSLPQENASYLHSGGIPIGSFDPAYNNLKSILSKTKFEYVSFFCENYFTHAYPSQVKYYVDQINANVLIPSHSFNPERLKPKKDRQQLIPLLNETYVYHNHKLVKKV